MNRRDFAKHIGLALAAGWAIPRFSWPLPVMSDSQDPCLALLADAHLKDGNPVRPEAQALARAVAEIRILRPAPDLVLFAGDLAHNGDLKPLTLGQEILSDLPAPLLLVRGEGDGMDGGGDEWNRLFGEPRFAHTLPGAHLLGLNTNWRPTSPRPAFALGNAELDWLAGKLARLDPALPLILLSHAPLTPVFQPWQQWTANANRLAPLLARFHRVLFLHGHVHQTDFRCQGSDFRNEWSEASGQWPGIRNLADFRSTGSLSTQNLKPKTQNLPLPATAWPLPSPLQGTPHRLRPGLAPHGCGWGIITLQKNVWEFRPRIWQA